MSPGVNSPKEREQERLVRAQGQAYDASYQKLMAEDPHAEVEAADYRITASFEPAEGMYIPDGDDGSLRWRTPVGGENQHFEVIVRDREDGRFIPELDIRLRLLDHGGTAVVDIAVPFIWHPFVLHYGIDGRIPAEGEYTAEVFVAAARFPRHDQVRGRRYAQDVRVRLGPVHLTPGIKPRGPE